MKKTTFVVFISVAFISLTAIALAAIWNHYCMEAEIPDVFKISLAPFQGSKE